MIEAARDQPGTVRELACRALVGMRHARCTASRLVQRGELAIVEPGRPAVLGAPPADAASPADAIADVMRAWSKPTR